MSNPKDRLLIPIPESCKQLGEISRTTVYKLVDDGELELVHIGRRSFITAASITAYVERLARPAMAPNRSVL